MASPTNADPYLPSKAFAPEGTHSPSGQGQWTSPLRRQAADFTTSSAQYGQWPCGRELDREGVADGLSYPMSGTSLQVGDNVFFMASEGAYHPAIVRFADRVPWAPNELWFGLEFQEEVGTTDGEVDGVRYFSCPPMHGIFCRASRLLRHCGSTGSRSGSTAFPPSPSEQVYTPSSPRFATSPFAAKLATGTYAGSSMVPSPQRAAWPPVGEEQYARLPGDVQEVLHTHTAQLRHLSRELARMTDAQDADILVLSGVPDDYKFLAGHYRRAGELFHGRPCWANVARPELWCVFMDGAWSFTNKQWVHLGHCFVKDHEHKDCDSPEEVESWGVLLRDGAFQDAKGSISVAREHPGPAERSPRAAPKKASNEFEAKVVKRVGDLEQILFRANISASRLDAVQTWCEDQQAETLEEIAQVLDDFARDVGLKALEKGRLQKALKEWLSAKETDHGHGHAEATSEKPAPATVRTDTHTSSPPAGTAGPHGQAGEGQADDDG